MLNEKQHAFIAAQYYRLIHELDPAGAERVFLFCTRKYAEERGARMAQRALRDGRELTLGTYMSYGEWEYTDPDFSQSEIDQHVKKKNLEPLFEFYSTDNLYEKICQAKDNEKYFSKKYFETLEKLKQLTTQLNHEIQR